MSLVKKHTSKDNLRVVPNSPGNIPLAYHSKQSTNGGGKYMQFDNRIPLHRIAEPMLKETFLPDQHSSPDIEDETNPYKPNNDLFLPEEYGLPDGVGQINTDSVNDNGIHRYSDSRNYVLIALVLVILVVIGYFYFKNK